jgi:hypothetical protein
LSKPYLEEEDFTVLKRNLKYSIIREKNNTIELVKMMGTFFNIIPYTSQIITDIVAKVNMSSEISSADLVRQVLITCGKNVMEEMQPAVIPKRSNAVILKSIWCEIKACETTSVASLFIRF